MAVEYYSITLPLKCGGAAEMQDVLVKNRSALGSKMLDLLLTRPVDFPLWRHNTAGLLRYLVVDELHTFDHA